MNPDDPVRVRRAFTNDQPARRAFYRALSDEDMWFRFFTTSRDAIDDRVDGLVGAGESVIVALAELISPRRTRIVGEAVLTPGEDPDVRPHEFAIVVDSRFQRRGIGGRLIEAVATESLDCGIDTWEVVYLPDNPAIERTLARLGEVIDREDQLGVIRGSYRLDPRRVGSAAR